MTPGGSSGILLTLLPVLSSPCLTVVKRTQADITETISNVITDITGLQLDTVPKVGTATS